MVFLSKPFDANFKSANHVRFLQELKTLGSEEPELAMPIESDRQRFLNIALVHVMSVEILLPVAGT